MSKWVVGLALLVLTRIAWAQPAPGITQWIAMFEEVRQYPLFAELRFSYAKTTTVNVEFSPVGVIPRDGVDCVVVISEGDKPKLVQMMGLAGTPAIAQAFLRAIVAHEFGHCFRIRSKHLTVDLWKRVAASQPGSAERESLEKRLSIEEA